MVRTTRTAANLFTGIEELEQINVKQMNALLLFESWPEKHEGPGDIGDNEGLGGLMDVVKKEHKEIKPSEDEVESEDHADRRFCLEPFGERTADPRLCELDALVAEMQELEKNGELADYPDWRDDKEKAELIFLEVPDELEAWLDRMRIKKLNKEEKLTLVKEKAAQLVKDAIIAVPPEVWSHGDGDDDPEVEPSKEDQIVHRLGFIFIAYRVDYWWWESMEMLRKFLVSEGE